MGETGLTRRTFLRRSLAAAAGAAIPLAGYAQFVEPHHLTVERREFPVANLPDVFDGFRIAQLSDFHYGDYAGDREVLPAIEMARSLKPDIIVFTGDLITSPGEYAPRTHPVYTQVALCATALSRVTSPYTLFACLGNHDFFNQEYVTEVLRQVGIVVLRNASRPVERSGKRIWIAGVDDAIFGNADLVSALAGIPAGEPVILIAHEPDFADEAVKFPVALQLSGHSHGGQVRLPGLTMFFLPELARKYPYGYYRVGNMHLYTNRGIGTIEVPYRFNAPPEVTLVTLRRLT